MKRLIRISVRMAVLVSVLQGLSSCAGDAACGDVIETLSVRTAQTKVHMDALMQTSWNQRDAVSVFYGSYVNERWVYSGKSGSPSGVLQHQGPARKADGRIAALYPYHMRNIMSGSSVTSMIPEEQTFVPGSFDSKAAVMTGQSSDRRSLDFSFAVSFLALELTGTVSGEITGFELRSRGGEPVAGDCLVNIDSQDRAAVIEGEGYSKIKLTADSETSVKLSATPLLCVFALAPGVYTEGFEIDVFFSGGKQRKVMDSLKRELRPGCMHIIPCTLK